MNDKDTELIGEAYDNWVYRNSNKDRKLEEFLMQAKKHIDRIDKINAKEYNISVDELEAPGGGWEYWMKVAKKAERKFNMSFDEIRKVIEKLGLN